MTCFKDKSDIWIIRHLLYCSDTSERPTGKLKAEDIRELSEPTQRASSPTHGSRGGEGRQVLAPEEQAPLVTAAGPLHPTYKTTVKSQVRDRPLDRSTPGPLRFSLPESRTETSPSSRAPCFQGSRTLQPILLIARTGGNLSGQSIDRKP